MHRSTDSSAVLRETHASQGLGNRPTGVRAFENGADKHGKKGARVQENFLRLQKTGQVSFEDVEALKTVFADYDADQSGHLDMSEFKSILEIVGAELDDAEFDQLVTANDWDMSGKVDFNEFIALFQTLAVYLQGRDVNRLVANHEIAQEPPMEEQLDMGLPVECLHTFLTKEIREDHSCQQLPWTTLLFLLFLWIYQINFQPTVVNSLHHTIDEEVFEQLGFAYEGDFPYSNARFAQKAIHEVSNIEEIYSWVRFGLVTRLYGDFVTRSEVVQNMWHDCHSMPESLYELGEIDNASLPEPTAKASHCALIPDPAPLGADERNYLVGGLRLVGGMRVRRVIGATKECLSIEGKVASCLKNDHLLAPETREGLIYPEGTQVEDLDVPRGLSQREAQRVFKGREDAGWLKETDTTRIDIILPLYHREINSISHVAINIMKTKQGGFNIQVVANTHLFARWSMTSTKNWDVLAMHITFVVLNLHLLYNCLGSIYSYLWVAGPSGPLKYISYSDINDLISIAGGVIYLLMIYYIFSVQEGMLKQHIVDDETQSVDLDALHAELLESALLLNDFHRWLMIYPFVLTTRFFKVFTGQPRLNIVTETLATCALDVFHFFVVFIAAFCGFAAMAHCLFSPYAPEFATYERSLFSTFKVIQDDFDWPVVREGGRLPGMIWNTSFVIVISYLMLNMLLSIVMDTYVEVKGRTGHAETLFSQGRESFRRYHQAHRGIRVTLRHIVNCLDQRFPDLSFAHYTNQRAVIDEAQSDEERKDRLINLHRFMEIVPNLELAQATRLLTGAIHYDKIINREDMNNFRLVRANNTMLQHMSKNIIYIDKMVSCMSGQMRLVIDDLESREAATPKAHDKKSHGNKRLSFNGRASLKGGSEYHHPGGHKPNGLAHEARRGSAATEPGTPLTGPDPHNARVEAALQALLAGQARLETQQADLASTQAQLARQLEALEKRLPPEGRPERHVRGLQPNGSAPRSGESNGAFFAGCASEPG